MKKYKYEKVMDYIRQNYIDCPGGDGAIPSEPVLAKKLNISRFPINQAVGKMVDEGILVRVDGIGTFVKGREPESLKFRQQKPDNLLGIVSRVGALDATLLNSLSQELFERNYFSGNIFQDAGDNYYEYVINKVRTSNIKGLFLCPEIFFEGDAKVSPSLIFAKHLIAEKIPTVVIERPLQGYSGPRVLVDNIGGTVAAVQWMLENGYEKIAYFGKGDYIVGQERFKGYRIGMEYGDLPYNDSLVALDKNGAGFVSGIDEFMEENIKKVLIKNPECRAFMTFNITFAYTLFQKLRKLGLFREDMIIGGFDPLPQYDPDFNKHYLLLEKPSVELGRAAADMMIRQLKQLEPIKEVKRIQHELYRPGEQAPLCLEKLRLLA